MDDRQRATTTLPCIILRALIILLSIVVIVLCSIAVKYTGKEYDYEFYADGLGEFYISMAYLPVSHPLEGKRQRRTPKNVHSKLTSMAGCLEYDLGIHRPRD